MSINSATLIRWRADPAAFVQDALINPEDGKPSVLYEREKVFMREAMRRDATGRLLYQLIVFSAPKKSGKTALNAWLHLYVMLVLAGVTGEGECYANDSEQSVGRVFAAMAAIIEASPLLRGEARVYASRIEFSRLRSSISARASDFAGAAGANQNVTSFTELWAYTSERLRRLWEETTPPPTRKIACRIVDSYSGFEGESELLEGLYRRGLKGREIGPDLYASTGMLMYWTHECHAPWQTQAWREQMRMELRPNAYLRLIENRWVSGSESFVDAEQWARCIDPGAHPIAADKSLRVWVGLDASTKRDSTAIVAVAWDAAVRKVRLITHRIFVPSRSDPIDFEGSVERTVLELRERFMVIKVRYDPYQMAASAQRLAQQGVRMEEFPQTVAGTTEMSSNLFELIKGGNLVAYDDPAITGAVRSCVAVETSRGYRVAKEKTSSRIDVVIALAMAALPAVHEGQGVEIKAEHFWCNDAEDRTRRVAARMHAIDASTDRPWW